MAFFRIIIANGTPLEARGSKLAACIVNSFGAAVAAKGRKFVDLY